MVFILAKERNLPWPKVLKRAVYAFNASVNSTTKVSPWEAVRGTPYLINVPNPNAIRASDPCTYRQEICSAVSQIQKSVRVANLEADYHFKKKRNSCHTRPPLEPGDRCCIYRPLARDKDKHFDWVGDYTVVDSNDKVSRLRCNKTQKLDWYSNHQIKLLPKRPSYLDSDSDDELFTVPVVPESGGAGGLSDSNSAQPPLSEICNQSETSVTLNQSTVSAQSKTEKSASSGRRKWPFPRAFPSRPPSSRKRSKTEKLNISTMSGKTYAAIARTAPVLDSRKKLPQTICEVENSYCT